MIGRAHVGAEQPRETGNLASTARWSTAGDTWVSSGLGPLTEGPTAQDPG